MKTLVLILRVLGYVWCIAALLLVLVSGAWVWINLGFGDFQELFNPFDIRIWLAIVGVMLPGGTLFLVANCLAEKNSPHT